MEDFTKQEWEVTGNTVYLLEHDGWRKGEETFRNRFHAFVQGHKDVPSEELLAVAKLMAAAPDLLKALLDARFALYGRGPGNPDIDAAISKATGKEHHG